MKDTPVNISIANAASDAGALAALFSRNLTLDYISHQELMGHRALALQKWAPDIEAQLRADIESRLRESRVDFPSEGEWKGVVEAHEGDVVVGLALIVISRHAAVPFGVIEDMVIDRSLRSGGRGKLLMEWIFAKFRQAGLTRAFLESGIDNKRAHSMFERLGFKPISTVMMKELN